MSSMQYVTAKIHVAKGSQLSGEFAKEIATALACADWDADVQELSVQEVEDFTEAEIKISGFGIHEARSAIEKVLEDAAALDNGSYGFLIDESDYGVEDFNCYGSAELAEVGVPEESVTWASEDFLNLVFTMEARSWQEMLGCDSESLADEIESHGDELLLRLLPTGFLQACEEDGDVAFQYQEMEPYKFEGETFAESENVTVIFELDGHAMKNETFDAIVKAINGMPTTAVKPLVRFCNASEDDGVYGNRMVDVDAYAMLAFKSSRDGIADVRVLGPKIRER